MPQPARRRPSAPAPIDVVALDAIRGELAAQLGEHRAEVNGELALLRAEMVSGRSDAAREAETLRNEMARVGRTVGEIKTQVAVVVDGELRESITKEVKARVRAGFWQVAGGVGGAVGLATPFVIAFLM